MKKKIVLGIITKIYGGLITIFMLSAFGPKLFGTVDHLSLMPGDLMNWYDNPTGFFVTYLIGYIIVWFRPLLGACIIAFGALLFFIINPTNIMFFLIFILPVLCVALLYLIYWNSTKKIVED